MNKKIGIFVPVVLGMLTAFGPFVTDFYLPSLPEMAHYFRTSPSVVATSLTSGMIGLAIGQVLIGPLSDKLGRKNILVMSMILFAATSLLCVFSPNIYVFNAIRVIQGLAGAGGIVISKSMATDMYTGKELTNFMAVLAAINGVAPICAPILGGTMANFTSWKGVFCLLLALGVVLTVCSCMLRETLPADKRIRKRVAHVYANLFRVFRNPVFTMSSMAMMFCFFTFFAYITSSPFIIQNVYHLSAFQFSLCFGFNALIICGGNALCTLFRKETDSLKWGAIIFFMSTIFISSTLLLHGPILALMASYTCMMIGFGLMQPSATSIALDSERRNAGAASAVFGAAGYVAGATSSPLVSLGNLLINSSIVMTLGSAVCLLFTMMLVKRMRKAL
jgi:DHA1 family bicyclomycin/chloramphenicol resistance-like MFS transporter